MLKARKSNDRAAFTAALFFFFRKYLPLLFFVIASIFFTWIAYASTHPSLPCKNHPLTLYSNQCKDDLKLVFLRAIQSAKSSIFIIIYGLTDKEVIDALKAKAAEGIVVKIFYDPSGSKHLEDQLPGLALPLKSSGLMHKKILVIDHKKVLLGSANLTETSLSMHDNLVLGLYHKGLGSFFEKSLLDNYRFDIKGQPIELWSLPEPQKKALDRILSEINSAKTSLRICMFTFTNKDILQALLNAKARGVKIEVAFDYYSARGSSKETLDALKVGGVDTYTSKGGKLLHHKWCLIDSNTLILGSTNWTGAAFSKNDDCMIFLHDLTPPQKKVMEKIWNTLDFAVP